MHDAILTALKQQESIGWLSCLKGFLSAHWKIVAGMSMHVPTVNSSVTAQGRLRHVVMSLHDLSLALWKGRNECVRRADISTDLQLHRREDLEIEHYHDHPEMLAHSDRHDCERPLQRILQSTPANRRRWICQVQLSRQRRIQDLQSQSLMPQYFQRTANVLPQPPVEIDRAPPPLPAPLVDNATYWNTLVQNTQCYCLLKYDDASRELNLIAAKALRT